MICTICPRACDLEEGQTGYCMARANTGGLVASVNYGAITSIALDPIEKKPLRRFFPGSFILSVGSYGCNLHCPFCQNHRISKTIPPEEHMTRISPEELAAHALRLVSQGNIGLAYTYNEPLVGYEVVLDTSRIIRSKGLKNVLVTNGMICDKPLRSLLPFIDAMNIDLKGFTDEFYDWVFGSGLRGLETVKNTIITASKSCHVEVTILIIPGKNDSEEEIRRLAKWLSEVDRRIPLHISRYHPDYRYFESPPSSIDRMERLAAVAAEYLDFVYKGNC